MSSTELLDLVAIGNEAARQLSDTLANVAARQVLPPLVYVMMTSRLGLESNIFTMPFSVTQSHAEGVPVVASITSLERVGNLNPNVSVAEHIAFVASYNPGIAFILDQETVGVLDQDHNRPVTLLVYDELHHLLTGLSERGIDLYLAGPMTVSRQPDGITMIDFKS